MSQNFEYEGDTRTRALVVHPALKRVVGSRSGSPVPRRDPADRLEEAVGLALAIDLDVVHSEIAAVSRIVSATYLPGGALERLVARVGEDDIDLVVVDTQLSPIQQRNLERALDCKVIDRTGLILEIFGERARTAEGKLQVELAHLSYQRSRLVRSWTHLERQRGGGGFMGGPGETQIELDRRLIDDRIILLKRQLEDVRRTRGLHRAARARVPYPVVALVGYTNAGKSSLFNRLTAGGVLAKDMLFATLDPTMRAMTLPGGRKVILSDTVGFVSDLPHELVAAFRATLEEVQGADLLVHVRDIARPDTDAQKNDVEAVLRDMEDGEALLDRGVVEALNKTDLLDTESMDRLHEETQTNPNLIPVSALSGNGLDRLLERIEARLNAVRQTVRVDIPLSDGQTIAWLHRKGDVLHREDDDERARLTVRLDDADVGRLGSKYPLSP